LHRFWRNGDWEYGNRFSNNAFLTQIPLADCIGKGTGVTAEKLQNKHQILATAIAQYKGATDLDSVLAYFGGFEILQIAGGMLEAHKIRC